MKILFYYRGAESFAIEHISSVLKEAGHTTELIFDPGFDDTFFFKSRLFNFLNVREKLLGQARHFSPDLLAFSSTTNLYPYVKDMAYFLKKELNIPAIIGGIHANVLPEYVLGEQCFDMLCMGEGEYAMLELADKMEQGKDFSKIKNLWIKRGDKINRNPERPLIQNLDMLPFADKDMFYKKGAFYKSFQISSSRGCPYRCTYCVNNFYFNKYGKGFLRRRGVEGLINELRVHKKKYNPEFIDFQDDIFAVSTEWLEEFSHKYRTEIGVKFHVNMHPAMANKRIARLLKEAGCVGVCMGIQSGSESLRCNLLKRNETNLQIREAARLFKEAGLNLITEFIFGLPGESPEQAWESVLFNDQIKPYASSAFVFYPFPGTELADYSKVNGFLGDAEIKQLNAGMGSYYTTLFLKNTDKNFFINLSYLLSLYVKMPQFVKKDYFKKVCQRKTSFLHKIIGIAVIPLRNPFLFREKLLNYLRMLWVYLRR